MVIRKIIIPGLAIGLIFLELISVRFFLGDHKFEEANASIKAFRWNDAKAEFLQAAKYNPLNSRYPAALADLMMRESVHLSRKKDIFKEAAALYGRAISLNPRCAEYYFKLGLVHAAAYLDGGRKDKVVLKEAFASMERAYRADPNGVGMAYITGINMLSLWNDMDSLQKSFVINRLQYALKFRPRLSKAAIKKIRDRKLDPALFGIK